jgi:hypothetical protein
MGSKSHTLHPIAAAPRSFQAHKEPHPNYTAYLKFRPEIM